MYQQQQKQKTKGSKPQAPRNSHIYRNIRDPLVVDATQATLTINNITTDGSGSSDKSFSLSPLGVQTVTALNTTTPSSVYLEVPHLPWLLSTARNFSSYRILRANLVYTSLLGSTSTGRVSFYSSPDFADGIPLATLGNLVNSRTVDMSTGAFKEIRYNLNIDSSWKKITSQTLSIVSTFGPTTPLSLNTVNDLIFSQLVVVVAGGPASTAIGSLNIEYDVEFKGPVGVGINF